MSQSAHMSVGVGYPSNSITCERCMASSECFASRLSTISARSLVERSAFFHRSLSNVPLGEHPKSRRTDRNIGFLIGSRWASNRSSAICLLAAGPLLGHAKLSKSVTNWVKSGPYLARSKLDAGLLCGNISRACETTSLASLATRVSQLDA